MWSYIVAAPPMSAVHYARSEGWSLGDKIAAEQLYTDRALVWRYTARNFQGGDEIPFPERIPYPGSEPEEDESAVSWETATLDDLVSAEVRELLRGA